MTTRMTKDAKVFEVGDPDHEGAVVRITGKKVLVHWAKGCTRWHRRDTLRLAPVFMSSKGISFCRCSGAGCRVVWRAGR